MCVVLVRVCSWPWLVEWKLAYKEKMFSEKPVFLLNKNCHSVRLCHSFSFHQNVFVSHLVQPSVDLAHVSTLPCDWPVKRPMPLQLMPKFGIKNHAGMDFSYGFFILKVDKITLIHIASEWHKLNKGSSHRAEKNGFLHPHTSWRVKVRFLCEKKALFQRLSTPPCNHKSVNTSGRRKPTWVEMYETLTTETTRCIWVLRCCFQPKEPSILGPAKPWVLHELHHRYPRSASHLNRGVRQIMADPDFFSAQWPSHSRPATPSICQMLAVDEVNDKIVRKAKISRPSPPKPIPLFATSWLQYWWHRATLQY